MNSKLKNENNDFLFECILSLKTVDECYSFFEDICTASELQEFGKRLKAAKMLTEGRQYSEITEQTGLSTATISRVNRSLRYGTDGYKLVLDRNGEVK